MRVMEALQNVYLQLQVVSQLLSQAKQCDRFDCNKGVVFLWRKKPDQLALLFIPEAFGMFQSRIYQCRGSLTL